MDAWHSIGSLYFCVRFSMKKKKKASLGCTVSVCCNFRLTGAGDVAATPGLSAGLTRQTPHVVLGAGRLVSIRALPLGCRDCTLAGPSHCAGVWALRDRPLVSVLLTSSPIHWGLGVQPMNFGVIASPWHSSAFRRSVLGTSLPCQNPLPSLPCSWMSPGD